MAADEWDESTPITEIQDPKQTALEAELRAALVTNQDLRAAWEKADQEKRAAEAELRAARDHKQALVVENNKLKLALREERKRKSGGDQK